MVLRSSTFESEMLFPETVSGNSSINDLGNGPQIFPSRTNMNLDKITLAPVVDKKVIIALDAFRCVALTEFLCRF